MTARSWFGWRGWERVERGDRQLITTDSLWAQFAGQRRSVMPEAFMGNDSWLAGKRPNSVGAKRQQCADSPHMQRLISSPQENVYHGNKLAVMEGCWGWNLAAGTLNWLKTLTKKRIRVNVEAMLLFGGKKSDYSPHPEAHHLQEPQVWPPWVSLLTVCLSADTRGSLLVLIYLSGPGQ